MGSECCQPSCIKERSVQQETLEVKVQARAKTFVSGWSTTCCLCKTFFQDVANKTSSKKGMKVIVKGRHLRRTAMISNKMKSATACLHVCTPWTPSCPNKQMMVGDGLSAASGLCRARDKPYIRELNASPGFQAI